GEQPVCKPRQLRQRAGPVRRLALQRANEALPANLVLHPALEVRLCGLPQIEIGVELAAEAFDVQQRLLQQHQLRLDFDVETARGLKQAQKQTAEGNLFQRAGENRLAHGAHRGLEIV